MGQRNSPSLSLWSANILDRAKMNRFEVLTKPVKYIHDQLWRQVWEKYARCKWRLTNHMWRLRKYCALFWWWRFGLCVAIFYDKFGKLSYVLVRGHVGKEVVDAARGLNNSTFIRRRSSLPAGYGSLSETYVRPAPCGTSLIKIRRDCLHNYYISDAVKLNNISG